MLIPHPPGRLVILKPPMEVRFSSGPRFDSWNGDGMLSAIFHSAPSDLSRPTTIATIRISRMRHSRTEDETLTYHGCIPARLKNSTLLTSDAKGNRDRSCHCHRPHPANVSQLYSETILSILHFRTARSRLEAGSPTRRASRASSIFDACLAE